MPFPVAGTQHAIATTIMRIAIAQWEGRVSPVFDVAGSLLLVEYFNDTETDRSEIAMEASEPHSRSRILQLHGVDVLICGAISRDYAASIQGVGIRVVPQVCGEVENVLAAYRRDELDRDAYRMPGCDR